MIGHNMQNKYIIWGKMHIKTKVLCKDYIHVWQSSSSS